MGPREIARGIQFLCLGAWAMSFFLPAFDTYYWSANHHLSGFGAVGLSILMGIAGVSMRSVSSIKDGSAFIELFSIR
jgi:hypothetical protein